MEVLQHLNFFPKEEQDSLHTTNSDSEPTAKTSAATNICSNILQTTALVYQLMQL